MLPLRDSVFGLGADGANEPRAAFTGQRKDGQKIRGVERDEHFAIQRRAAGVHVGNVKTMRVSAADEINVQQLPHQ